jgi:hypothetical protein
MNFARFCGLAACSIIAGASASADGFLSHLFHHDFEVIANGDVSPERRTLPLPTADHPEYYIAVSEGFHDFGGIMAGDKLPQPHDMIRTVTTILAKQGYKLATNKNQPTVMIAYSWGTLYPEVYPGSLNRSSIVNRFQIWNFVGYGKQSGTPEWLERGFPELSQGLSLMQMNAADFMSVTDTPYYVIAIVAYDYNGQSQEKAKPRLRWRTRISTPCMGFDLDASLPKMMAIAAPYIGRDTAKPIRIRASDHYQPNIEFGEPRVIPNSEAGAGLN